MAEQASHQTNQKVRVGIVGCGGISRAHVRGYRSVGGNEIVAVFDPSMQAAEAVADETGAKVVSSVEAIIGHDVDAVSVCSPPSAHYESAIPFLEQGIAVICEKPLGVNAADAHRLSDAIVRSNSVFMTAFCYRFHPPIVALKKLIESGEIGVVTLFRNIFGGSADMANNHRSDPSRSGGGPLIDHCSHSVDLFRFLIGNPETVSAVSGNIVQSLPIEDFGMMHLAIGNSVFGEITGSYSLPGAESAVEVFGTKGVARVDYSGRRQQVVHYRTGSGEWQTIDAGSDRDRFEHEMDHFLSCVRDGRVPSVSAEDGLAASQIVEAAYESVRTGARVKLEL